MRRFLTGVAFAAVGLMTAGPVQQANAALLTPNGNPTGPDYADSPAGWFGTYRVHLDPIAAAYPMAGDLGVISALIAGGFTAENGWTVSYFDLEGTFTLGTYVAWTETRPQFTQGIFVMGGTPSPGSGGAAIGLNYTRGGNDPLTPSLHWLQAIGTNWPAGSGGIQESFTWYIDNAGRANDPFYDTIPMVGANSTDFADIPGRSYDSSTVWYAKTHIATGDLAAKVLNISEQYVYWGFTDPQVTPVPEPCGLVLSCIAGLVLSGYYRLRRPTRGDDAIL